MMATDDPIQGLQAKVHRDERTGTAKRIYSVKRSAKGASPRATAVAFLKRHAEELGLDPRLSYLKYDKVKESILGKHVLFQQYCEGLPVSTAWVRVDLAEDGSILGVQNDALPAKSIRDYAGKLGVLKVADAKRKALSKFPEEEKKVVSAEEVMLPVDDRPVRAWKLVVRTRNKEGLWRVYIDARTGKVMERTNMLMKARGRVFDPTPVAALDDSTLNPRKKMLPDSAYRIVQLPGLNGSGYLDGPYVSTSTTRSCVRQKDGEFLFLRHERPFKEVMVYFHIDRAGRRLKELGFEKIFEKPIRVNVDGITQDQSWYDADEKWLVFGTGGVDDAEDGEVILHEYAHAIQDAQVPGWGDSPESAAMGEGFGDFFAASLCYARKPKRLRKTVFSWDCVTWTHNSPPCCRRLDSRKKYPRDLAGEEHDDGEIWSACLWELRSLLGKTRAERVIIAHHQLCSRRSGFTDAAHRVLQANEVLYNDKNRRAIRAVFERRGIIEKK